MTYATVTELADYLDILEANLPEGTERLLERASDMIDYYTLNRIEAGETATEATVRQYEWWSQFDEFMTSNFLSSVSIGPYSAGTNRTIPDLAPRAKQVLFMAGLLYKGVDVR